MISIKLETNQSPSATENEPSSKPETSEDVVTKQTRSGTSADNSASDTGECGSSRTFKREVKQETYLGIQNPHLSSHEKCHFTFTLDIKSRKPDHSEYNAYGELNENVYSALRAHDIFSKKMEEHVAKDIRIYEERHIKGYINPGMPLKCLPKDSHLKITFYQIRKHQKKGNKILRECENPNIECILFHIVAVGKNTKTIVKMNELHQPGTTLCVYALKGETIKEALCKDGRFRSDLKDLDWKLVEVHKTIYGRESKVEEVSGKTLEIDISKNYIKKAPPQNTKPKKEHHTDEVSPSGQERPKGKLDDPERGGTGDREQNRENIVSRPGIGHDVEATKRRTILEIKNYYSGNVKRKYRIPHCRQRSQTGRQYFVQQKEAINLSIKNLQMLNKVTMHQYPSFKKAVREMRKFFLEERRRKNLSTSKQFNIYKKDYAKVTKNSTSVATCEQLVHLSHSVGFIQWNNNGRTGNGTCFVFNDGFIFTCRHVVELIVGEVTDRQLWQGIVCKCAMVTFNYKQFRPVQEEWFPIEALLQVSDENLDYAILKLGKNEKESEFPPGLFGQVSSLPSSGLIYLIGHPEGEHKKVDGCTVIPVGHRLEKYSQYVEDELLNCAAANISPFSMFTPRSFQSHICRTDALSYDTCFADGSSGSPVFDANGRLVAIHALGIIYSRGDLVYGLIEYGYSMESVLCDIQRINENLYQLLCQGKQDSTFEGHQIEAMEH
ncbi:serine protease FAM111B [Erinaceus europaeus]|uniref:Serine protease FAM111B n=1 Tax=Erinaceus europaeus TaxID=9365 RepID=A0A1S2ZI19_ERIEU|nr:serine protease FAM111B [Erinaceus europaeus]